MRGAVHGTGEVSSISTPNVAGQHSSEAARAAGASLLCKTISQHIQLSLDSAPMLLIAKQPPCPADTVAGSEIHFELVNQMKTYRRCAGHIRRSHVARAVEGCLFAVVACPVVCALHLPWSMQHEHMLQLRDSSPHILRPAVDPLGVPQKQAMSGARYMPA